MARTKAFNRTSTPVPADADGRLLGGKETGYVDDTLPAVKRAIGTGVLVVREESSSSSSPVTTTDDDTVYCEVCGDDVGNAGGRASHMRAKHPDSETSSSGNKKTKKQKNTSDEEG